MSVTFNRTALITVATQALVAHAKAASSYDNAVAEFKRKHAQDNANVEGIRALRDYLSRRLKTPGTVILRSEVRKNVNAGRDIEGLFYTGVDPYTVEREVPKPDRLLTPAEVAETEALLQVLRAATGDTISANELKLLGLKNLAPVFKAAAYLDSPK